MAQQEKDVQAMTTDYKSLKKGWRYVVREQPHTRQDLTELTVVEKGDMSMKVTYDSGYTKWVMYDDIRHWEVVETFAPKKKKP